MAGRRSAAARGPGKAASDEGGLVMRASWSKSLVREAQRILKRHTKDELESALAEVSKAAGLKVSQDSIRSAFKSKGLKSPLSYMKQPEFVPDPVQAVEAKEEESREKKQVKQLVEELREARSRQSFLDLMKSAKAPPRIMPREKSSGKREMTCVVLASDWHVEEPVEAEAVAYRNEYNLRIAEQRIDRFFRGIIWNVEHQRASGRIAVNDLILWLGGDLITGYIHDELVESNELSPTETICWLIPKIRDGIYTLMKELDLARLEIPCSYGNHGRTTAKPRVSTGYANSFEWLMYHQLASEFRSEKRVHFEITNSPHQYVQVYDRTLHFHHGDSLRYQGGVGGLAIPLLKAVPQWDLVRKADVHNIGHFHQLSDFGRAVVNGSMIGYGPYSQHIRASFEVPQQALYYVDKIRGKCMMTPLWLDDEAHYRAYQSATGADAAE